MLSNPSLSINKISLSILPMVTRLFPFRRKSLFRKTLLPIKILYLTFITFFSIITFAETAFASEALIENSGTQPYKSVRISPEIAQNSNMDFSDLLVKDENRENIPYFINSSSQNMQNESTDYLMSLINSYSKDNEFYFDYLISDLADTNITETSYSDIIATSIHVTTPNDGFAKNVVIYGSYDNINWEQIQEDKLYSVDGNSKLQIEFNSPQKFTHYRFKLDNNLEKIVFDDVYLNYSFEHSFEIYFEESFSPKFSVVEIDKQTEITVNGLKHLRIKDIKIETKNPFKRNVSIDELGISKELYHLSFDEVVYSDTIIEIPNQKLSSNALTIAISNYDDKPIEINDINVRYYADEIIFEDKGNETFLLEFSGDNSSSAPIYDIESYKEQILKGDIDNLIITEIKIDEVFEIVEESYDYKLIFNIGVLFITAFLGIVILLKLIKKKPANN